MAQTSAMDRGELRHWVEDALSRHDRDARERGESVENVTVPEIVDAVWGRLPLEIRRATSRGQVQASLTMITLRQGIAAQRDEADAGGSSGPSGLGGPDGPSGPSGLGGLGGPAAVTGTPRS
jgi:hypothetical protein